MGEKTKIEWTARLQHDGTVLAGATFNPWWGCDEISPACANCYAREWAARFGTGWGKDAPRTFYGDKHWNALKNWDRQARAKGYIQNVFVASMADLFEDNAYSDPTTGQTLDGERARFFEIVEETPNLMYLLLTKRPENMTRMAPAHWADGWPKNVAAMTTAENQKYYDLRIPELLKVPSVVRGVSMEPLLGPVNITKIPMPGSNHKVIHPLDGMWSMPDCDGDYPALHWVITGGESGDKARVSHYDWFDDIRKQCEDADASFFHKQWGEWLPYAEMDGDYEQYFKPWPAALRRKYSEEYLREFRSREYKIPVGVVRYDGKFFPIEGKISEAFESIDGHAGMQVFRVTKPVAGRKLRGREWNGMPAALGGDLPQSGPSTVSAPQNGPGTSD